MNDQMSIVIEQVTHRYDGRVAVDGFSLSVAEGEIFALLGPNGSGKTTLFRLLSTLIPLEDGQISIAGCSLPEQAGALRRRLGVVFQAPSLDKKLTVGENLQYHGRLYGLSGARLAERCDQALATVGLSDRVGDLVETLSGGMRRRVELAKCLLHEPTVLLMDEPSTGLDPGARIDLWRHLETLRREQNVTILLTTHLLEEAERADRIAIMHQGKIAAVDSPSALRASMGGDAITIKTREPETLAKAIEADLDLPAVVVDGAVRLEHANGQELIARLIGAYADQIETVTWGRPTLEDVFIDRTGHQFFDDMSAKGAK